MKHPKFSSIILTLILLTTIVMLYFALRNTFSEQEENGCEMTFMFEYPEYIKVKLKKKVSMTYPRYGLYIYGEGSYAYSLKKNLKPNGVPVLFVPGNGGSYRQVRSLASVALRKASGHSFHFNYFTVDLDEDLSGLYGGILLDQVNFVHSCIRHIIKMYDENWSSSHSVVLIGHSMGGVIARALFALGNFPAKYVSVIITLGTPHLAPVVTLDSHLRSFYNLVNDFWKRSSIMANISIVSLAGGSRDLLVPSRYCSLPSNNWERQSILVTTVLSNVWLTIDHLALCWCKQLVLVINRALFDLVVKNNGTHRIATNTSVQVEVLQQYFGGFKSGNTEQSSGRKVEYIDLDATVYNGKKFLANFQRLSLKKKALIQVDEKMNVARFIALSSSFEDISITTCEAIKNKTCFKARSLSLRPLPKGSVNQLEKAGTMVLPNLANISHLYICSLKRPSILFLQFQITVNLEMTGVGVKRFRSTNLFINISLPMITNNFDAYFIKVEKVNCQYVDDGLLLGKVHLPWTREDVHGKQTHSMEFTLLLNPHLSKPTNSPSVAQLHVWKNDFCSLDVTIHHRLTATLGRILILRAPSIVHSVYSWLMVFLIYLLSQLSNNDHDFSLFSVFSSWKLLKFLPLVVLLSDGCHILRAIDLVVQSQLTFSLLFYDRFFPSAIILLTSFTFVTAIYVIFEVSLMLITWVILVIFRSRLNKSTNSGVFHVFSVIYYTSLGVGFVVSMVLCSPIAVYLLTLSTYIICCRVSIMNKISTKNEELLDMRNKLNLGKIFFIILTVISVQLTPAFIVWVKVLPTCWCLPEDPFRPIALILLLTVACLKKIYFRKSPKRTWFLILSICYSVLFVLSPLDRLPLVFGFVPVFAIFQSHNKEKEN